MEEEEAKGESPQPSEATTAADADVADTKKSASSSETPKKTNFKTNAQKSASKSDTPIKNESKPKKKKKFDDKADEDEGKDKEQEKEVRSCHQKCIEKEKIPKRKIVQPKKPEKPWRVEKQPCLHNFCIPPKSDPSNYPKGLPWASDHLKCLPGHCHDRRKLDEEEKVELARKEEDKERAYNAEVEKCRRLQQQVKIDAAKDELVFFLRLAYKTNDIGLIERFKKRREEVRKREDVDVPSEAVELPQPADKYEDQPTSNEAKEPFGDEKEAEDGTDDGQAETTPPAETPEVNQDVPAAPEQVEEQVQEQERPSPSPDPEIAQEEPPAVQSSEETQI